MSTHSEEIEKGERFSFGENWEQLVANLTEEQIKESEKALQDMLETDNLDNLTFLDAGSGSGLSSLSARRLGALVHSFDYDPHSCAATQTVREQFFPEDNHWQVEQGSVLDKEFLAKLPLFDIVYSWGVLHHTGEMWQAIDNVCRRVKPGGLFFIAIYNDPGSAARHWLKIKRLYCSGPVGQWLVMAAFFPNEFIFPLLRDLLRLRNPLQRYRDYHKRRGMSRFRDWLDWLGGYPYEVAKPEEIFDFLHKRGFSLQRLMTTKRTGNNQFVFRLDESKPSTP
jgi:2-polyprenyl-3-methyl-5-hydroxy-6-metoxy-1,4-benzoquinol methylase